MRPPSKTHPEMGLRFGAVQFRQSGYIVNPSRGGMPTPINSNSSFAQPCPITGSLHNKSEILTNSASLQPCESPNSLCDIASGRRFWAHAHMPLNYSISPPQAITIGGIRSFSPRREGNASAFAFLGVLSLTPGV